MMTTREKKGMSEERRERIRRTTHESLEEGFRIMREDIAEFNRRAVLHQQRLERKGRQLHAARI